MSRKEASPVPVVEWSPTHVTAYDPVTRQLHEAGTIADLAGVLSRHKELIIAVSRRSSFVRTARVPNAPKSDLENIVRLQLANLFPVPSHELALDFHVTNDVNTEGRLAVIAAVKNDLLRQLLQEVKSAGFTVRYVTAAAFGSWLLAHSLNEHQGAVVEHTHEGLSIDVIFDGDLRYTRVAPFPSDSEELDAEVCRTFNIAKVPCSNVIAAGGIAFEGATSLYPGRSIEAFTLPVADRLDVFLELPEKVAERARKKLIQSMQRAIALSVILLAASFLVFGDRVEAAQKANRIKEQYAKELADLNKMKTGVETRLKDVTAVRTVAEKGFKPAQPLSDVISVVTNSTPSGLWLTGMTVERGKPMLLRGTATTNEAISAYLATLSADERFRDVKLVFATDGRIDEAPVFLFSISGHVVGNLPLGELKGAKK